MVAAPNPGVAAYPQSAYPSAYATTAAMPAAGVAQPTHQAPLPDASSGAPPGSSPFGAVIRRGAAAASQPQPQLPTSFELPRSDYSDLDKRSMDFNYASRY